MAPNPQCGALAAAMSNQGLTYAQVANKIGKSEQHVIDICTGNSQPTPQEFEALASALGISSSGSHGYSHAKK